MWFYYHSKMALLDAKCVCLLDGEEELLVEHLRGAVGRQVEPVEAGVRPVKKNICWKESYDSWCISDVRNKALEVPKRGL